MSSLTPKKPEAPDTTALPVTCPGCARAFRVRAELAGKRIKCPKCAQVIPIPKPDPEPELEVAEVADELEVAAPPDPLSRVKRWLFYVALAIVAAMVYGCAIVASMYPNDNHHLGAEYYNIAKSLVEGEGYANPFQEKTGPTAWMPPILSTLLAALIWLCEGDVAALKWIVVGIQVHVLLATGWLVVALARKTSPRPVIASFLAAAVYCFILLAQFRLCFMTTHDCWLVLLAMDVFVYGLCWHRPLATNRSAAVWGLCGGTFSLINPIVGFAWSTMCGITAIRERRWQPIAVAFLVATLVHAPWTIRNFLLFGRIIPIKSNLAYELYQSQVLQKDGLLQAKTFGTHPYVHPNKARREYKEKGEIAFLDEKRQIFIDAVLADPLDFGDRMVSRFLGSMVWYQSFDLGFERRHSWVMWLNRVVHPLPLLAVLVLAYSAFWRPLHPAMWAVIGIFLLYQIPYVIISYYERYAVPALGVKAILTFWLIDRVWSLIARTPLPDPLTVPLTSVNSRIQALTAFVLLIALPAVGLSQEKAQEKSTTTIHHLDRELLPVVRLFGPDLETVTLREPGGLRVKLAAGRKDSNIVGVNIAEDIQGSFDISGGFELFKAGEPLPKYGSGVAIRVHFDTPETRFAQMSRTRRPNGEMASSFLVTKADGDPLAKEQYKLVQHVPAVSPRGRLRVTRQGDMVQFWLKDGDDDYVPAGEKEMGGERIKKISFFVTSNWEPKEIDARLVDVAITAEPRAAPVALEPEPATTTPAPPKTAGRGRLIGAGIVLLTMMLGALGFYWIRKSRRIRAAGLAMAAFVPLLLPAIGLAQEKGKKVYDLSRELPEVKVFGPQAEEPVKREKEGLRITLAAARKDLAIVGIEIPVAINGAFDISTGFEILKIAGTISQYGAGVAIRVHFDTPDLRDALISRTRRAEGGDKASAFLVMKKPDGKDDYKWQKEIAPASPKGRLRISRTGGVVQFWVKDGDGDYVSLKSVDAGPEPVKSVKVYATSNYHRTEIDVRLTDVSIDAEQGPSPPAVTETDVANPPPPGGRGRLLGATGVLLALVLGAVGIYWIRRSRA